MTLCATLCDIPSYNIDIFFPWWGLEAWGLGLGDPLCRTYITSPATVQPWYRYRPSNVWEMTTVLNSTYHTHIAR